ncbi:hypothetical protein VTJ83DRAFT_1885 [Remersonia thermophila]|uniref:Ribosomal RNA-processing protein 17 n=1 Tax=Remersonia thermophila TaxID=72144 RepID=A0ABR4DH56_9PEZI
MFAKPRIRKMAPPPPPKKRKTVHAIEEISFDPQARTEYLTGFRKRKQERIKRAQEIAEKKAREARIEMRKQIREQKKQEVEEHVQALNKILREAEYAGTEHNDQGDTDEEWGGISDEEVPEAPIDVEEEYIDEDKYTTVTVEAVSVDRDGLHKPELDKSSEDEGSEGEEDGKQRQQDSKSEESKRPKHPPKKKKKFRYENKFERALEQRKQKAKKRKLRSS